MFWQSVLSCGQVPQFWQGECLFRIMNLNWSLTVKLNISVVLRWRFWNKRQRNSTPSCWCPEYKSLLLDTSPTACLSKAALTVWELPSAAKIDLNLLSTWDRFWLPVIASLNSGICLRSWMGPLTKHRFQFLPEAAFASSKVLKINIVSFLSLSISLMSELSSIVW